MLEKLQLIERLLNQGHISEDEAVLLLKNSETKKQEVAPPSQPLIDWDKIYPSNPFVGDKTFGQPDWLYRPSTISCDEGTVLINSDSNTTLNIKPSVSGTISTN